jgi:tetratricopeptide (TPR) repeat protein
MNELSARARSLKKAGQWEPAAEAFAELVELFPDDASHLASFSNVLGKLQRWPEAAATAARVDALSPGNAATATRALRLLLRVGDLKSAREVAERCRDLWSGDAMLALLASRALAGNGEAPQALELLRRTLRFAPDFADLWFEAAKAAQAAGDPAGALELALEGARRHAEDLRLQRLALRLGLDADQPHPDLPALANAAVRLAPDDLSLRRLAGRTCARARRWSEAIAHFQRAADLAPGNFGALAALLKTSEKAKDYGRAADTAARITHLRPADPLEWRKLANACWRAGREADSRAAFAHSVALRVPQMPVDFASGLRAFWHRPGSEPLGRERLNWAYSLQAAAHRGTPIDREDWERAARWGHDASLLLVHWLEVWPERFGEIASLTDIRGLELLERPVREGRGVFLATAHLGPAFAMAVALHDRGLPFRWLSGVPPFPGGPVYESIISVKYSPPRSTLPVMHAALTGGQIVAAGMDLDPNRPARTSFLGQMIRVNETAARMVHWTGADPLFLDPRWVDGRIVFQVLPMVAPGDGEGAGAYLVRWKQDFVAKMADIVTSAPENLLLEGGLWSDIRDYAAGQEDDVSLPISASLEED